MTNIRINELRLSPPRTLNSLFLFGKMRLWRIVESNLQMSERRTMNATDFILAPAGFKFYSLHIYIPLKKVLLNFKIKEWISLIIKKSAAF